MQDNHFINRVFTSNKLLNPSVVQPISFPSEKIEKKEILTTQKKGHNTDYTTLNTELIQRIEKLESKFQNLESKLKELLENNIEEKTLE